MILTVVAGREIVVSVSGLGARSEPVRRHNHRRQHSVSELGKSI